MGRVSGINFIHPVYIEVGELCLETSQMIRL